MCLMCWHGTSGKGARENYFSRCVSTKNKGEKAGTVGEVTLMTFRGLQFHGGKDPTAKSQLPRRRSNISINNETTQDSKIKRLSEM